MTFLGWKLSTGEVVGSRVVLNKGESNELVIFLGEHEAPKYREVTGYKGRMTPQYTRS